MNLCGLETFRLQNHFCSVFCLPPRLKLSDVYRRLKVTEPKATWKVPFCSPARTTSQNIFTRLLFIFISRFLGFADPGVHPSSAPHTTAGWGHRRLWSTGSRSAEGRRPAVVSRRGFLRHGQEHASAHLFIQEHVCLQRHGPERVHHKASLMAAVRKVLHFKDGHGWIVGIGASGTTNPGAESEPTEGRSEEATPTFHRPEPCRLWPSEDEPGSSSQE